MTRVLRPLFLASGLLAALGPVRAASDLAALVPAQSEISFVSRQMGVPVSGSFRSFDAQVRFDPAHPQTGQFTIGVDLGSVQLPTNDATQEIVRPTWFDAARYPRAVFESSSVRVLERGRYEVQGRLSIKGHAQDVVVPVALEQAAGLTVASGALVVHRLAFEIGDGEWADTSLVADEVQIRFRLALSGIGPI